MGKRRLPGMTMYDVWLKILMFCVSSNHELERIFSSFFRSATAECYSLSFMSSPLYTQTHSPHFRICSTFSRQDFRLYLMSVDGS